MNTSVIIPSKIQNTAPKPTKAQLIEALMERAQLAHEAAEIVHREKYQIVRAAIETEARLEFAKMKFVFDSISTYENYGKPHIDIHFNERTTNFTTAKITKLLAKLSDLAPVTFDREATKRKLTEKLKAPNPLLDNPDTAKALDALLATLMSAPKLTNTVDV